MLDTIRSIPATYGIYQYIDASSKLLYVGKAKNLKNRVKSYWRFTPSLHPNPSLNPRIIKMLTESVRIEYIVVESEEDALILENSLIKQLRPKYNILLRDDKTYPYIYIDESQPFPRFEITRKVIKGKKIKYYGPFPTGSRALLDALYEIYPLVQKKSGLDGGKACLFHQIGKCLAPCEQKITTHEYHKIVTKAKNAISSRKTISDKLEERMMTLATQQRYEEAAKTRDQIDIIKALKLTSSVDMANAEDIDLFCILCGKTRGVVVKLFIRAGKVISSTYDYFRQVEIFDTDKAYRQVLLDFYGMEHPSPPKSILVADRFGSIDEITPIVRKRLGRAIEINRPQRGDKKRLIDMSIKNAQELLKQTDRDRPDMEAQVQELLGLERRPYRVEIFDNSHMMGVATVGAMVVWDEGRWDRSSYRRYELSSKDEYAQMTEMLQRRISRFDTQPAPDLWVLDGGKANVDLALELLGMVGVNLDVIGLAKEKLDSKAHRAKGAAKDSIYTSSDKINLKTSDKRLQWLQRLRDESHRFAITYHQNLKRKQDTKISHLNKKGVGKATIKKLIDYFGTFEALDKAGYEEIRMVTNKKIADLFCKK